MVEVQDLLLDLYLFIWFSSRPVLSQSSDLYNFGGLPFDHSLTLRRPLRKKLRMRWFFDVSKVKESSFYIKIIFWVRWFKTYSKEWDWREKMMFIHSEFRTYQPLITSFYIKNTFFCRISDESALIRNFLRNGRLRG